MTHEDTRNSERQREKIQVRVSLKEDSMSERDDGNLGEQNELKETEKGQRNDDLCLKYARKQKTHCLKEHVSLLMKTENERKDKGTSEEFF